jgi:LCP family protein required for cell wall assembly
MESEDTDTMYTRPSSAASPLLLKLLFAVLLFTLTLAAALAAVLVGVTVVEVVAAPHSAGATAPAGDGAPAGWMEAVADIVRSRAPKNMWAGHGPIHVLLMGTDTDDCREDGEGDQGTSRRADTIIVVRIDPELNTAAMLSLPRDLYAELPIFGAHKINAAHSLGEAYDYPGGGPALMKDTLEYNLGIKIDRWVRVDYKGFRQLIDALGGVDIEVPSDLVDWNYPDGHCGVVTVSFEPGWEHMDGQRLLQYVRTRYTTSDFDRAKRQQQALMSMRCKAMSLRGVIRIPLAVDDLLKTVDTDFTARELVDLAPHAMKIDQDAIGRFQVDRNVVHNEGVLMGSTYQSVLVADHEAMRDVLSQFLSFEPPTGTSESAPAAEAEPADSAEQAGPDGQVEQSGRSRCGSA